MQGVAGQRGARRHVGCEVADELPGQISQIVRCASAHTGLRAGGFKELHRSFWRPTLATAPPSAQLPTSKVPVARALSALTFAPLGSYHRFAALTVRMLTARPIPAVPAGRGSYGCGAAS
ncbi:hypothetical protein GCM10027089_09680 [Nocardia thraciensis]